MDKVKVVDWPEVTLADGGAAEIAKLGVPALIPAPDNGICRGEPLALSVITICADRAPICAGVNTTEIEQLAPAARLAAQDSCAAATAACASFESCPLDPFAWTTTLFNSHHGPLRREPAIR
jgi:hypothetical protein